MRRRRGAAWSGKRGAGFSNRKHMGDENLFRACAGAGHPVRKKTGSHHGATLLAIAVFTASVNAAILDEARQAEPGPSVLALLAVSTALAVLILGIVSFVFFRT